MKRLLYVFLALLTATVGVSAWWRFAARRRELPCPAWLAWILENPYTETFAGSRQFLDCLDLRPGMRVLDVGAGPGRLTIPAAERVGPQGEVVALDVQAAMLDRLRARAAARGLRNIRTRERPIGVDALEPNTFDRAWLALVLGEIPDQGAAIGEIYAARKPGGILAITEMLPDPHYQTRATVNRLAADAGFQVVEQFNTWAGFTMHLRKPAGGTTRADVTVPRNRKEVHLS